MWKKAECQKIVAFELWCWRRLLRVPWTSKRFNQSILRKSILNIIGRTDAEIEAPIPWPPVEKSWLIRKDPDVGKDWRQEEKWTTEDEIIGWHHQLNGLEFEPAPEMVKDSEAWRDAFHGVAKSRTWLSNWTTTMVTHQKGIQLWFFVGLIATLHVYSTYHPQILCNNSFIGREMKS